MNTLLVMEIKTEVSDSVIIFCHYDTSLKECVNVYAALEKKQLFVAIADPCVTMFNFSSQFNQGVERMLCETVQVLYMKQH